MPSRTQQYIKAPWTGGWNTSVDKGILPDNDLVTADNIVFTASGSRLKREGIDAWDSLSDVPAVSTRASSGTTRTIVFASTLTPSGIQKLVVGEKVVVTQTTVVANQTTYYIGTWTVLTVSGTTMTFTATGSLTETTTAATGLVVKRRAYLDIKDCWLLDNSGIKTQYVIAVTDQGKLFKYTTDGKRTEITPFTRTITCTSATPAVVTNTGAAQTLYVGMAIQFVNSGGALPTGITAATTYYITTIVTPTTFQFSLTPGGTAVNTSSTGTGTHSIQVASTTEPFGSGVLTGANSIVFANRYILCLSGFGNKPIYFDPYVMLNTSEYFRLGGYAPDASFMQEHLGRLWANDKTSDLLHYSTTGDFEEWQGVGDSGALDIVAGDGDPTGVTAIFPPFKGRLIVAKRDRSFQISGFTPEDWTIEPLSNGIGSESHAAVVAVDMDDVMFWSRRGVHSLKSTANFGDFETGYISQKIKPTFEKISKSYLSDVQGVYVPELNAVAWTVTEEGNALNNALWLYSITTKEWFRWPDQSAISLCTHQDASGKQRLMWSTSDGEVRRAQNGDYTDVTDLSPTGAILYKIVSGTIYPDSNPHTIKGFKKLSFLYKPKGKYQFNVKVWVDNIPVQSDGTTFAAGVTGAKLGSTFILGSSVLGSDAVFAPFTMPIDGYGRGIRFEITNYNEDQQVEIFGYTVEYEPAGTAQEVV
jgi:hypothetical protein